MGLSKLSATMSFILFTLLGLSSAFRYDGFAILEVIPKTQHDIDILEEFDKQFENDEVNFQYFRGPVNGSVSTLTILVSPMARRRLETVLIHESITYSIRIEDYQKLVDREYEDNRAAIKKGFIRSGPDSDHTTYLRYHQIEEWLIRKVKGDPFAKFIKFGETFEKRKLFMVKISRNSSLPVVWLDGGTHAREWISVSSVLFVIDKLMKNSAEAQSALSKYQFVIVPLVNPDGYEYTHEKVRLWRKNRAVLASSSCVGVDLNRNYPYKWGDSSKNPCNIQYRGPFAASEKEIQSVSGALTQLKDNLQIVVNVHAYGQMIMYPFSYSVDQYPSNYLQMTSVAMTTAFTMLAKHNVRYSIGRPCELFYPTSGTSDDYAIGTLNVPYSFGIELPDLGHYGFTMPPRFIRSVGQQLWDILDSVVTEMAKMSPQEQSIYEI